MTSMRFSLLSFLMLVMLLSLHGIAQAQGPYSRSGSPDQPDWSQFLPRGTAQDSTKPAQSFYDQCLETNSPEVTPASRRDMCACMASHEYQLRQDNKPQEWTATIQTRALNPDEVFIMRVVAPCIYLELGDIVSYRCLRDTTYLKSFKTQQHFEAYCSCYTRLSEGYAEDYAEPLLGAQLMSSYPIQDPADAVLRSLDFVTFMGKWQKYCIAKYDIMTENDPR